MAPDETTSDGVPIDLGDSRLLIEAARRLARRRRQQDGVLAAAVVVVVLTIALASSGVFQRQVSVQIGGPPVVVVPAGTGFCPPVAAKFSPDGALMKVPGGRVRFFEPGKVVGPAWAVCVPGRVFGPGGPVSRSWRVWKHLG
ncbi:MAG TPA: hypothetical protein VGS61_03800 [Acidimicrobiales bacterium]|nr:hypothetical protein [Acidimicrobiales bacterium]